MNEEIDYFADGEISDADLETVANLAARQVELQKQVAYLEGLLKNAKGQLFHLSTVELPNAMAEVGVGLDSIKLKDGATISIKKTYYGSINDENRVEALSWLRANNFDGLIKNVVSVSFGKGEDRLAVDTAQMLARQNLHVEQKESVHPQTLKAFIREVYEKGINFPFNLFGAGVVDTAIVKLPEEN